MRHPDFLALVLLGLALFRLTRLVGWDEITVDPRRWVTGIADTDYNQVAQWVEAAKAHGRDPWSDSAGDGHPGSGGLSGIISERRYYLAKLVRCPWCIGFWLSVTVWLAWWGEPRVTLFLATPLALSAIVGLVAKNWDP